MFKLKVQNIAFFAIAPTLLSRYCYQQSIEDRVDVLWRIHQTREKQGLGGTNVSSGLHRDDDHTSDRGFRINNGIDISMNSILTGRLDKPMHANPFTRFH